MVRWPGGPSGAVPTRPWRSYSEPGVPATMSYSAMDLLADPHLHDREVFHAARDQDEAPYIMMGLPWKFSRTEPQVPTRPPRIGEHNPPRLPGQAGHEGRRGRGAGEARGNRLTVKLKLPAQAMPAHSHQRLVTAKRADQAHRDNGRVVWPCNCSTSVCRRSTN